VRVLLALDGMPSESREAPVRHPLSAGPELFGLVGSWLRSWAPAAAVIEVRIELPQLEPAGRRQLRLWVGGDGSLDEVTAALERLQDRFGEEVALRPRPALTGSPVASQRYSWELA
jgi:hypothetical protein